MKRQCSIWVLVILIMAMTSVVWADGEEVVTIANTAKALTATSYLRARSAMCRLETAAIRYTKDGATTPTDAVGMITYPLEWIMLDNAGQIKNFRGIRTTGTSGSLTCFYFD